MMQSHPRLLRYAAQARRPLSEAEAHGFAARHALVHWSSRTVLSYIPKNACTMLRFAFAQANGFVQNTEDYRWIHTGTANLQADLRDLATAQNTFVVMRCPHSRLASNYLEKIARRQSPLIWRFQMFNNRSFDPDTLTFRQYVALLHQPGSLRFDHHWRPQADFLVYDRYDHWIALENLAGAKQVLGECLGIEIADLRKQTKHGSDRFEKMLTGDFSDVPAHEIRDIMRTGKSPGHSELYTPDLVADVARLYSKDVEIYDTQFGSEGRIFPAAKPVLNSGETS